MIYFKSCPRCRGDLLIEDWAGEEEAVCLQCGCRVSRPPVDDRTPALIGEP